MLNEARGLRGPSCEISSQLVKQYDQDTSFSNGYKLHIAFSQKLLLLSLNYSLKRSLDKSFLKCSMNLIINKTLILLVDKKYQVSLIDLAMNYKLIRVFDCCCSQIVFRHLSRPFFITFSHRFRTK